MTELSVPAEVRERLERGDSWEAATPVSCVFCGDGIPSLRNAYRKVVGFEKQRDHGGTNALALRRPLDEWACNSCVDKQKSGVNQKQEELL